MVILLGGQGAGKGTLARILRKIWSATYVQVHQIKSITGQFNGSIERAFIVWLDEAIFDKNRGATDSLKSLVTEPVILINVLICT
jgi:predicted ATPase